MTSGSAATKYTLPWWRFQPSFLTSSCDALIMRLIKVAVLAKIERLHSGAGAYGPYIASSSAQDEPIVGDQDRTRVLSPGHDQAVGRIAMHLAG
jgi:hypothetical protein